jgi:uncharacterized protein YciI
MRRMYAVQLAYADTADDERIQLRPAHRERLKAMAGDGRLLLAGPWADDTGALLVFLVDTRDDLDAILADDPYYSAPGVTITGVHEWNAVTRHESLARF